MITKKGTARIAMTVRVQRGPQTKVDVNAMDDGRVVISGHLDGQPIAGVGPGSVGFSKAEALLGEAIKILQGKG